MDFEKFLEKKIKPLAEQMDNSRSALQKGFRRLGRNKLLALRAPEVYGGQNLSYSEYFEWLEELHSYSGALGFFQRQHQAAARFIAQSSSDYLKAGWLPLMAKAKRSVGVSVSHMRQLDSPKVTGELGEEGWYLKGDVSWVSGYRLFGFLVVGFFLPEQEEEAMALIPFKHSRTLRVSKPLKTVALSSMQTVHLNFKGHIVPESHVFSIKPMGTYKQASSNLGVHFVNLSALALAFKRELEGHHHELYLKLCDEYEKCREEFLSRKSDDHLPEKYARMHRIATELCHLVRFKKAGPSLLCPNSIERRYRELMLFGVIAGDPKTQELCLNQLIGKRSANS